MIKFFKSLFIGVENNFMLQAEAYCGVYEGMFIYYY